MAVQPRRHDMDRIKFASPEAKAKDKAIAIWLLARAGSSASTFRQAEQACQDLGITQADIEAYIKSLE